MTTIDLIKGNLNILDGHPFATNLLESLVSDLTELNEIKDFIQSKLNEKIHWDISTEELTECRSLKNVLEITDKKINGSIKKPLIN